MSLLIRNARIISPDREIGRGGVLIEDGRIAEVIEGDALPSADAVIDAGGRTVMPGFIDIHSHGADGADVCDDRLESVRRIAERKLREGVTTWLPTTLTQPREKLSSIVGKVAEYAVDEAFTRCPGVHVEGPFINRSKAGAQNPEFVREPDFQELETLHERCPVKIVSLAPELPGARDFIRRASAEGIVCSAAHTAAGATEIEVAKSAGLKHLTHFANAMTGLHHREIGVVGAGLLDDELMLEVIADGIHLSRDMLRLLFKVVPAERLMLITDSTAGAWLGDGGFQLGGLDVVVADGAARLKEGGELAGSTLRFNEGLKLLAETTGLPLHQLVKATSWNQARSLGLEGFGKLEPGFHADLVILDDDFSVWKTLVGGEER